MEIFIVFYRDHLDLSRPLHEPNYNINWYFLKKEEEEKKGNYILTNGVSGSVASL